ncbi:hypothetical protein K0M31_017595 [Melipona bicolor]|uniref:Uncharacterized protein n=1 Tax=Melipona bicolor TaxID=60889 RepID=A0AA40KSK9_9HYME|nr:hypothetical protein K0M31_017595 [Melipona bicolor]
MEHIIYVMADRNDAIPSPPSSRVFDHAAVTWQCIARKRPAEIHGYGCHLARCTIFRLIGAVIPKPVHLLRAQGIHTVTISLICKCRCRSGESRGMNEYEFSVIFLACRGRLPKNS